MLQTTHESATQRERSADVIPCLIDAEFLLPKFNPKIVILDDADDAVFGLRSELTDPISDEKL